MTTFSSLMRRADDMLRAESDPAKAEWWRGYVRGLRRAHHGERFGSEAEHATWLAAADSDDPLRAALGKGYAAGLTLESRDPPASDAERAAKYKASGRQVAIVLRDPAALAALDDLVAKHGGVTAAITTALVDSAQHERPGTSV